MYIAHRINTMKELVDLPDNRAIEFDVRDSNGRCIVQHDPFKEGLPLNIFLDMCGKHRFLIVNIKSEGIEATVLQMLRDRSIEGFFLLDSTVPAMYKYTGTGEKRFAVRLSEVEPIEFVEQWKDKVDWVWADCFSKNILTKSLEERINSLGFKICIVSPELQGRPEDIEGFAAEFQVKNIHIDAICTKEYNIERWSKIFSNFTTVCGSA